MFPLDAVQAAEVHDFCMPLVDRYGQPKHEIFVRVEAVGIEQVWQNDSAVREAEGIRHVTDWLPRGTEGSTRGWWFPGSAIARSRPVGRRLHVGGTIFVTPVPTTYLFCRIRPSGLCSTTTRRFSRSARLTTSNGREAKRTANVRPHRGPATKSVAGVCDPGGLARVPAAVHTGRAIFSGPAAHGCLALRAILRPGPMPGCSWG